MKTKVQIVMTYQHMRFEVGSKGYIDGYVRGGDDTPCAVVVVGIYLDYVPIHALHVLSE